MNRHNDPIVSIVLPTYNRSSRLGRSIRSVLSQTFMNFELIVVDDGSTDDSQRIVESFNDQRIVLLKHEVNMGGSAARNTGIKAATGVFVAFQDSDDEWLPEKLEKQLKLFEKDSSGNLGIVLCEVLIKSKNGYRCIKPRIQKINHNDLLYHRKNEGYYTIQLLVKKSLVETELYFDEKLASSQEWDFLTRLTKLCRVDFVPEPLVRIHETPESISSNQMSILETSIYILKKYNDELKKTPKALRTHYTNIAINLLRCDKSMKSIKNYLKLAIQAYPLHPSAYYFFFFSIFGHRGMRLALKLYQTYSKLKSFLVSTFITRK